MTSGESYRASERTIGMGTGRARPRRLEIPLELPRPFRQAWKELNAPPAKNIGGLDILRSLAILLVLAGHFVPDYESVLGGTALAKLPLFRFGWTGVDLFFVLSGYLIGDALLRELKRSGTIDLPRFMVRRALRLWPLYFATIALLALTTTRHQGRLSLFLPDLFFFSNYQHGLVTGGWSLSTEEQFYLLLPLVLLALRPYLSFGRLWLLPTLLLALLPLIRALTLAHWNGATGAAPPPDTLVYSPIHTHADGLLVGLLLAWLAVAKPALFQPMTLCRRAALPLVLISVGLVTRSVHKEVFSFTGLGLIYGGMALFVLQGRKRDSEGRSSRSFHLLSRLSYGMYLNHMEVSGALTPFVAKALFDLSHSTVIAFFGGLTVATGASVLLAFLTYSIIERPFLQLRSILESRKREKPVFPEALSSPQIPETA